MPRPQASGPRRRARAGRAAAFAAVLAASLPATAQDAPQAAGPYLAARAAARNADFEAAAESLARALAADPADRDLLEGAVAADLGRGDLDAALGPADALVAVGHHSPLAHMARAAAFARAGDWRALLADQEAGRGVGPLVDGLGRAWARVGQGDLPAALAAFDEVAASPGLRAIALTHKAFALAASGDLAAAEAILALPPSQGMQATRRGIRARAQMLGALGRPADGLALLDATIGADPGLAPLREALAAGRSVPYDLVETPAEGLAEALFAVAGALDDDPEGALLHARAALALSPDHGDAAVLAARLLLDLDRPDLAAATFALVAADDPARLGAGIGRAAALRQDGRPEEALAGLDALAAGLGPAGAGLADVEAARGDVLRGLDRLAEAEAAYGRALDLGPAIWPLHYRRARTREALGDWPGAEADLRAALALAPAEPDVLNHLGYSLLERGGDPAEALGMIEAAVAADPGNGAVVDSLGWALFKLGRHAAAVGALERAASILPGDAVVNDHLGDAYWAVGRAREARFQWAHALRLGPEDPAALRAKLAEGLDPALVPRPAGGADLDG